MKKLLTLLLLCPAFCFSQKRGGDTTASKKDSGLYILNKDGFTTTPSLILGSGIGTTWATTTPTQDTIRVMLLVCDTAFIMRLYNKPVCWWQYGYEVVDLYETKLTVAYYVQSQNYLDQNKKPLSKSIVVWMAKQIQ